MMKLLVIAILAVTFAGCVSTISPGEDEIKPVVSLSAKGWTIKPGPPADMKSSFPTTIVVNPKGEEFNIGYTQYPDFLPATLWIVEVKELKARFMVIRIPPAMSASVGMPILYLDKEDRPSLAGSIRQRWEFRVNTEDEPGFDPTVGWDGGEHHLRDILFKDINSDGIPELKEYDIWKCGGTVTYFRFADDKTFVPVRIEKYIHDMDTQDPLGVEIWVCGKDQKMKLVSRTRAKPKN